MKKTPTRSVTQASSQCGRIIIRVRRDIPELDKYDTTFLMMDLKSVPELDLLKLLEADTFTFVHDVCGIVRHMDRSAFPGKLKNCFLPRCLQNTRSN